MFQIVDASLEQRVVLTLQNIVDVMLQDFTTSIEEDEALLLVREEDDKRAEHEPDT